MNEETFAELLESVREGGAVLRREKAAARQTEVVSVDVKTLRESRGLSQSQFADALGVGVATLRSWEQGRRQPLGPARVLLRLAQSQPEVVFSNTHSNEEAASTGT